MAPKDSEILQGQKLLTLFHRLVEKKVIVSVHIVGTHYEQLTVIKEVEQAPDGRHLIIDPPNEFQNAASGIDPWVLRFNLNGPDRLEYLFTTRGGGYVAKGIRLPLPENAERLQRRRNFRVNTLPKTKLLFVAGKIKGVMLLNNISLGGAFGGLIKHNRKNASGSILEQHQLLDGIAITFPSHNATGNLVVIVKKARVVRVERHKQRSMDQFALEFLEISRDQRELLIQAIYQIQRYYLKNR